ncbi:MAG: GHMP kinase [Gammaproteobacteria bacterium]|nr:GHMP kinase [Gammaproteobacteria bacterium]
MTNSLHARSPIAVHVDTPARLHLGFMDMSGALGRRFGSLGLSIDAFHTRITVHHDTGVSAHGPGAQRAETFARRLLESLAIDAGVRVEIETAIPDHLGLGSGTQMALAVGKAISALFDVPLATRDIAARLVRGRRSGIGVGAFDHGGFLLDSGVGRDGGVPPVTAHLVYPDAWRVLLVLDARGQGLHGTEEVDAFRRLPPFPADLAARLCHLAVMKILPGVQEAELQPVAEGIAELQRCVGDHFAPAQGGRFTSQAVADALSWAESLGHCGVGQSSWGPTGFVLLPDQASAETLRAQALREFSDVPSLRFVISSACNHGSRIARLSSAKVVTEA